MFNLPMAFVSALRLVHQRRMVLAIGGHILHCERLASVVVSEVLVHIHPQADDIAGAWNRGRRGGTVRCHGLALHSCATWGIFECFSVASARTKI